MGHFWNLELANNFHYLTQSIPVQVPIATKHTPYSHNGQDSSKLLQWEWEVSTISVPTYVTCQQHGVLQ
jgi:hypothetical protein